MNAVSVLGPEPIRLGFGEFSSKNSWAEAVVARECFLEAMLMIEPRTFHSLVTQTGIALSLTAFRQDSLPCYRSKLVNGNIKMMIHRTPGPLHYYLQAWKRQWNLPDHWIDVLAAETLVGQGLAYDFNIVPFPRFVTVSSSAILDSRSWKRSTVSAPEFSTLPHLASVDFDGNPRDVWDPYRESRSENKKVLMAAFESALDEMLNQIAEPWVSGKLRPTIVKRNPEHFDWVVHYQVLGKSYGTIQKSLAQSTTRQGIAKAIKETAALIGLTLRQPNRAGAPKKKLETSSAKVHRDGVE